MIAAVLHAPSRDTAPLHLEERPVPEPAPGEVLLRVEACGVCRTDLHIVTGELRQLRSPLIPGHQLVARVVRKAPADAGQGSSAQVARVGQRVGICWLGGTDGNCLLCRRGLENLCDNPVFTGYSIDGGYAQYAVARADYCFELPENIPAQHLAPLLCAGVIGYRSLRVAGVERGERVGLFGFGAAAHLAIDVLRAWGCDVYVATRGVSHQHLAASRGAAWVGEATERPPVQLDRAITFAPSGQVVLAALASLRKGGVVAINAIHLDQMPAFDYDSLLWGERQIRSVANMTRQDAREFIALATAIGIQPRTNLFPLHEVNQALRAVANDAIDGAAVVLCE